MADSTDSFVYFAYGSSLEFDEFAAWCTQHSYTLPDLANYQHARLHNYVLALNVNSKFWGGGVASIAEFPGSSVDGIAIRLPISQLDLVRHKEGAQTGLYVEIAVIIELERSGELVQAVAYQAAPSRVDPSVSPSVRYGNALLKGARDRGLSSQWLSYLSSLIGASLTSQREAPVTEERIRHLITAAIPVTYLHVVDESGGCGAKFLAYVVSDSFRSMPLIDRHRAVNQALQSVMPNIHALSLKTWTPEQYHAKVASGEAPQLTPLQLCS